MLDPSAWESITEVSGHILHCSSCPHSLTHHSSEPSAGSPTACLATSCSAEGRTAQEMRTLGPSLTFINDCSYWAPTFPPVKWSWWYVHTILNPELHSNSAHRHLSGGFSVLHTAHAVGVGEGKVSLRRQNHTEMGEKAESEFCLHSTINYQGEELLLGAKTLAPGLSEISLYGKHFLCLKIDWELWQCHH